MTDNRILFLKKWNQFEIRRTKVVKEQFENLYKYQSKNLIRRIHWNKLKIMYE